MHLTKMMICKKAAENHIRERVRFYVCCDRRYGTTGQGKPAEEGC